MPGDAPHAVARVTPLTGTKEGPLPNACDAITARSALGVVRSTTSSTPANPPAPASASPQATPSTGSSHPARTAALNTRRTHLDLVRGDAGPPGCAEAGVSMRVRKGPFLPSCDVNEVLT